MSASSIATTKTVEARAKIAANRRARARIYDRIATGTLWGLAGFITLVFLYIVTYIISKGLPYISRDFFTSGNPAIGIAAQLFNTFYLLILSLLIMIPIGIGAAIYTSEYAQNQRFLRILRFAVETLTSAPSLLIGLFGFLFFVANIKIFSVGPITVHGMGLQFSRISGALALAVLNVPWLLRTSEDALRAVPGALREASLAAGATKWQTTLRVVIPAAIPGLVTSILITSGRVIGETAALIFTAGAGGSVKDAFNLGLNRPGETLAYHAYSLYSEPSTNSEGLRAGTSLVLIVLVLVINISARVLGNFLNNRFAGRRA
ncbi:MAG: phosphate ABC transporter permease PstA [Ktedonobacterales bacterium]|nr:phosphate ABC transporter permease PstA [Ktedonobacterales bacterium]